MSLIIPDFSQLRVLVVGDLMLDQYWFGSTARISPEAPVPVVNVSSRENRAGGAANVAINLIKLGAQATCCGIVGDDDNAKSLKVLLESEGARVEFVYSEHYPTITKSRVLSVNQQLIRLDTEKNFPVKDAEILQRLVNELLPEADVVIFSDYGKGSLFKIEELIAVCRKHHKPVFVDPKGNDFSLYVGAKVLTPNYAEFCAIAGTPTDDSNLIDLARSLCIDLKIETLIVTLGERGILLVDENTDALIPAHRRQVFDVTGAGDTVIATLAASIGAGLSMNDAARLANLAASLVIQKIGASAVTSFELGLAMNEQNLAPSGALSEDQALNVVLEMRSRDERLVMTNGCFDLLHRGHVAYLQEAKSLGDRLLVAVNSDDSVKRLKGADRPINTLDDRISVLSALSSVDWIVSFDEDTPEKLIEKILPDVLVKGGDYKKDAIAGGKAVLKNGGTLEVLSFHEGQSSSEMIRNIRKRTD